ncbi:MAG: hypothetical protein WBF53_15200, partial [Litorimonas sp.]
MTQTSPIELGTLRKRSEFLHVREGDYAARGAVVIQCRANPAHADPGLADADRGGIRYGVT